MSYSFITDEIITTLRVNHSKTDFATESIGKKDIVVKFFNPYGPGDWWIYSIDDTGMIFGIADIFEPEYGYVYLNDLKNNNIERDMHYSGPNTFEEVMIQQKGR